MKPKIHVSIVATPDTPKRVGFSEMKENGSVTVFRIYDTKQNQPIEGRMIRAVNSTGVSMIFINKANVVCAEGKTWKAGWHNPRYMYEATNESLNISIV